MIKTDYRKDVTSFQERNLMTEYQKRKAELKVVKVLKYWQDADIFSLKVKKLIAEHVIEELSDNFRMERGL